MAANRITYDHATQQFILPIEGAEPAQQLQPTSIERSSAVDIAVPNRTLENETFAGDWQRNHSDPFPEDLQRRYDEGSRGRLRSVDDLDRSGNSSRSSSASSAVSAASSGNTYPVGSIEIDNEEGPNAAATYRVCDICGQTYRRGVGDPHRRRCPQQHPQPYYAHAPVTPPPHRQGSSPSSGSPQRRHGNSPASGFYDMGSSPAPSYHSMGRSPAPSYHAMAPPRYYTGNNSAALAFGYPVAQAGPSNPMNYMRNYSRSNGHGYSYPY